MQKIQFDYFTGMEAEQYSFYRVPKVLFTEPCFKTLSCEAKVLYGLMLDRMSLSIKNRWLDSEDRVYIIFTVEEIAELMNCGTQKAVKLVKELDSSNGIGLIEKKRLGLGKPNVIYVKNFMIREVPDQKPTGNCANLQSEQEDHRKIADLQSKQERHKECADLQQEAENKGKTGISLNCENHHLGVVKTTIQDYGESQFQNSENHNSRMVETTNPEFPESQFQNSENHHSRIVEITNPECPKSQSNNTDINKTDISETEIKQSYPITSGNSKRKKDVMEEMRAYRELADWEKYDLCRAKILESTLKYEEKQFLYSNDWWMKMYRFKDVNLIDLLNKWDLAQGDLYWPIIKSSMYAIAGEKVKGEQILGEILPKIRQQLVKNSKDEYLCSIEECIVSLLNFMRQGDWQVNLDAEMEACIQTGDVNWWGENEEYCSHLNEKEDKKPETSVQTNYDLSITYTSHMGRCNSKIYYALDYLRFLEQTGHPFRIQMVTNTKGFQRVIETLYLYYPHWCLIQILIAQNEKELDMLFGRNKLSGMTQEEVDNCIWSTRFVESSTVYHIRNHSGTNL